MLDSFRTWINKIKDQLKANGVETEAVNMVDPETTDNPSITCPSLLA